MFSWERSQWAQAAFDAGRGDVRAHLHVVASEIAATMNIAPIILFDREIDMTEITISLAVNNIMMGNRIEPEQADTPARELQLVLQEEVQNRLGGAAMSSVRDIVGGLTNEAVYGSGRRTNVDSPRPNYWFTPEGVPTYRQNSELFADYFSHSVRRPDDSVAVESLENMREWLPDHMRYIDKIMEEAVSGIGGLR